MTRDVREWKIPRRKPLFLQPEWVPVILDSVPDRWRDVFRGKGDSDPIHDTRHTAA
jgi:hypothetical protein